MAKNRRRKPKISEGQKNTQIKTSAADQIKIIKPGACVLALILAAIPFALGKYIEFNTPGPFDSGSYVYSAQHIADGARLYVDELASAQPGTLLMNFIGVKLFGFSETGPMLIQMLLQITALTLMFIAVRKLYGSFAACVSVILASLYLSAPLIAKFGNVKEQFMIAFMVISASCFIMSQLSARRWWIWLLACGAAAINVYYFKQTGASVIIAIAVYLSVKLLLDLKNRQHVLREVLALICGGFIGMIPLSIFYIWQNQFDHLKNTLPMFGLILLFSIALFGLHIYFLVWFIRNADTSAIMKKLATVRKPIWVTGLVMISVIFLALAHHWNNRVIVGIDLDGDQLNQQLEIMQNQDPVEYYLSLKDSGIPLERGGLLKEYLGEIVFIKYPVMAVKYPLNQFSRFKNEITGILKSVAGSEGYIGASRKLLDIEQQRQKVFRFYKALIVPILFAVASIIAAIWVLARRITKNKKQTTIADRLVIMLAVWWILDMLFVWISPRSYEQYYLPLTASAAMLAGYICSLYAARLSAAKNKPPLAIAGAVVVLVLALMTSPIFAGQYISPHNGTKWPQKRYGFAQSLERVSNSKKGHKGHWEVIAKYINARTGENDKIYVWGWYPGIYVQAQRLSPAKKAFESEMHTRSPRDLANHVNDLVKSFEMNPPKYIVDSRKPHFPWDRPPLELWPTTTQGLLPNDPWKIQQFDREYMKFLERWPDEAARYDAMSPLRKFVMQNYEPAEPDQYVQSGRQYQHNMFGDQRVFRLKTSRLQR